MKAKLFARTAWHSQHYRCSHLNSLYQCHCFPFIIINITVPSSLINNKLRPHCSSRGDNTETNIGRGRGRQRQRLPYSNVSFSFLSAGETRRRHVCACSSAFYAGNVLLRVPVASAEGLLRWRRRYCSWGRRRCAIHKASVGFMKSGSRRDDASILWNCVKLHQMYAVLRLRQYHRTHSDLPKPHSLNFLLSRYLFDPQTNLCRVSSFFSLTCWENQPKAIISSRTI